MRYILALYVFLLCGCGLKPVPQYDPPTVEMLWGLYIETDEFIDLLSDSVGTLGAKYESKKAFYKAMDRKLRRLDFQVNTIPNNTISDSLVRNIRAVVIGTGECRSDGISLQDIHACDLVGSPLNKSILESRRGSVERAFRAALLYENEKKRIK